MSDFDPLAGDYGDRVTKVIDLLRDRFGEYFKRYFDDDPGDIAAFDLPCVIVSENQDVTSQGSMSQDDIEEQILIKVVFDKKDDYRNDKEVLDAPTQRKLRAIVGRRDETTGHYMDQTVKGAIRDFGRLDQNEIADDMTTEYGIQPRDSGLMTIEAHVTFGIQYSVDVRY
ncbi:hypothetical protein [Curtobacterium sp. MCSS17_007]|uniref:hypothetical protein n=1 Tax=Curtobacterium sp. MCSS17_007 TaxID=2175646 RepID=UPI000DA80669|nr:hypothetical protein [Curtobacterium sp. MCSS17_007]WIE74485.1 hypothetical protein DEJ22_009335 [Curtobacterium sp. MCSS17_007]